MRLKFSVTGVPLPSARKIETEIKRHVGRQMKNGIRQFQKAILMTPVYTGRTLVNFRWSVDNPQESLRPAVKVPALPGKTAGVKLGAEPRRGANAALVNEEYEAILRVLDNNPFKHVFLLNNVPNFTDVEYGTYRDGARTPPGGMVRRGEAGLTVAIPGLKKSE